MQKQHTKKQRRKKRIANKNEWLNKYVMKEKCNSQQPSTSRNLFKTNFACQFPLAVWYA